MELAENIQLSREQRLASLTSKLDWDLIIIGGGITGAGILKLATQVGLKVLLLEQKDFAWGSSSRSSKMVHGGLRYIAEGQIKLTKESVEERQRLIDTSHGLVKKQSFALSHYARKFPSPWIFNCLLSVYDWFAGNKQHGYLAKKDYLYLTPGIQSKNSLGGTQFVDAMTDDARLVLRLIQESQQLGNMAINYAEVKKLLKEDGLVVGVEIKAEGLTDSINLKSKMVVNATGAWVNQLFDNSEKMVALRPLRGSHIIVNSWRLPVATAISVPHPQDKRPVQIFPWQNVTVIGTTDVEHCDALSFEPKISLSELNYLLDCIGHQFPDAKLTEKDIVSTFAGVRPVIASGGLVKPSQEKREHSIWKNSGLVNIAGGKLTTFRVIAQQVLKLLSDEPQFKIKLKNKTFENAIFEVLPAVSHNNKNKKINDLVMAKYGCLYNDFINQSNHKDWCFIGYSENLWAELVWAAKYEQVKHLDDLLLRRTRIGNILPNGAIAEIDKIQRLCFQHLNWTEEQWQFEINRYQRIWTSCYSLPDISSTH